jgi:AcrR family transcriptional regulator
MVMEQPPVRRGPRGPYAKSERTQKAILEAALEVFAESGYQGGSLRNVAERVGISEAGLLHHFPSKAALLAAVLQRRDEHSREEFDFDESNGRTVFTALVELARKNASIPGVVELFCRLSAEATAPDHPAHEYFRERYEMTRALSRNAFQDLARRGQLRPGVDPESAARSSIALMDGLQIQWLLDRNAVDMAEELHQYFATMLVDEF